MCDREIIRESRAIESLLEGFESRFPSRSDFQGYVNHCLRMLNVALALCEDEPDRREKIEIALAFHDLTIFPDRTLDYLESSAELARQHLAAIGRHEWSEEITLMIAKHHKIGAYTGKSANLVEAFRKADWLDVTYGLRRYGLPRRWVRSLYRALPLCRFPRTVFGLIPIYMVRHPRNPLPNFRAGA